MLYEPLPDDMGCLYTYMHIEIVVQHISDEVVRVSFFGVFVHTLQYHMCPNLCASKNAQENLSVYTPLKTNMSSENQWLEDVFPIEMVPF